MTNGHCVDTMVVNINIGSFEMILVYLYMNTLGSDSE